MLQNFRLPIPSDDGDRKLLADVHKYGWHILKVPEDNVGPGFCFSVGLYYTYGHPELLVMGLPLDVGHKALNSAGARIAHGEVFHARDRYTDLLENFSCSFVPISRDRHEDYLGYAKWFYRDLGTPFPALQLVWPDKEGHLPWDEGYDQDCAKQQHLLDTRKKR